ncbi:hypothetical protein ONE63_002696 [Megalurothrips usitatus]|uniref:Uncharacterized protein n=1 Tax=Megalurothrips usitatus TaxID=439358 RepID=A0AAV7XC00_9NEOP|nr:hypothetical protein ONE63_002696 [Megalurothrips usitatus]
MLMASLRDPYAAAAAGVNVNMLAASQLAQLNQLMMQQQQQQQHHQLHQLQQPLSPSQAGQCSPLPLGGAPLGLGTSLGTPLGTPPECQSPPISRTYTYKKVTKPLLERKRRARINRCLDELKELMVGALEAEGENVSKLEKADILELTVRHLQRITKPRDVAEDASRFQAGFSQCASEACHFLLGLPGLDAAVGRRLVAHLGEVVAQVGAGLSAQHPGPGHRQGPAPSASPSPSLGGPSLGLGLGPHSPSPSVSGRGSPADVDAEGEVSSSTSTVSWTARLGKRPRSRLDRSEADDDSDDDDDQDSDAPVNYTTEALRRQQQHFHSKRPRYFHPEQGMKLNLAQPCSSGSGPAEGEGAAAGGARVSSSRSSSSSSHSGSQGGSQGGSHCGSDDEDKGPMWRPW